jgi:hypothetical protein
MTGPEPMDSSDAGARRGAMRRFAGALQERLGRLDRRHALALLLALAAFAAASIVIGPRVSADGTARVTTADLLEGQPVAALRTRGSVQRGPNGVLVAPGKTGRASFLVSTSSPKPGDRTILIVAAGGEPGSETELWLTDSAGTRHLLGRPQHWRGRRVDVTRLVGGGSPRLEFIARNPTSEYQNVVLQVRTATYPPTAIPSASRWEVALWAALAVLLVAVALRGVRQYAALAIAAGVAAFVAWPTAVSATLDRVPSSLWEPSIHAEWLDLDTGLLSGTFGNASHLAVQLFHAFTPITGTGSAAAWTASILVGILALAAIFALGRRVAGAPGALTAVTCALLADPFRLSLPDGSSTGTLVLVACLFLLAVHRTLLQGDRTAMVLLGAAGALTILAEPTWWPGVLAVVVFLAVRQSPRHAVWPALATALLSLVLLSLPSRVSVAHQAGGDVNADVIQRMTYARNVEFVGRGHGAPADRDALAAEPMSGPRIGLFAYVFGEHSASTLVGSTLSGAYEGFEAASAQQEVRLPGSAAFVVEIAGLVFLLLVPGLRLLVLIPAAVSVIPWFFLGRGVATPFQAEALFWPALLVGAAAVAYATHDTLRRRLRAPRVLETARARVSSLRHGAGRSAEPAKP